jgi:hypothetical protein
VHAPHAPSKSASDLSKRDVRFSFTQILRRCKVFVYSDSQEMQGFRLLRCSGDVRFSLNQILRRCKVFVYSNSQEM